MGWSKSNWKLGGIGSSFILCIFHILLIIYIFTIVFKTKMFC